MFSDCPSVLLSPSIRPKPEIPSFHLYTLIHPTNRDRFAACPSVRPSERLLCICRRTHGGNGLKFCMPMYLDHFQNWLDYGHGLLIFFLFGATLTLFKRVKLGVSRHFPENASTEWLGILYANVSRPFSEMFRLWSLFVDFSNFGTILT